MSINYKETHDQLTLMYYINGELDKATFIERHDQLWLDKALEDGAIDRDTHYSLSEAVGIRAQHIRDTEGSIYYHKAHVKGA